MTFAALLKDLREKAGLTQHRLAELAGMPLGTLRQYEHGRRVWPTLDAAVKLADALGIPVERFADTIRKEPSAEEKPAAKGRKKG